MPSTHGVEAVLEPKGTMDITKAKSFSEELLAAISDHDKVTLKLAGVDDADMSFFQLLCSAHREATSQGKHVFVDNRNIQEVLKKLVFESGMARDIECHHAEGHKCLWCGEGWS